MRPLLCVALDTPQDPWQVFHGEQLSNCSSVPNRTLGYGSNVLSAEVARDESGLWLPGVAPNPEGVNQFTPGSKAERARRIKARFEVVAAEALAEPECIEDIVDNLVKAMKTPDVLPIAARLAFERLWPAIQKHELRADGLDAPSSSAEQWARLAEDAGSEVIEVESVPVDELENGS